MAKTPLCLALLALLAVAGEAASFNSLCRANGRPTKFRGTLTNGGKNAGVARFCFSGDAGSIVAYYFSRVRNVDNFSGVVFTLSAPAASGARHLLAPNDTIPLVEISPPVPNLDRFVASSPVDSANVTPMKDSACAGTLSASIVVNGVQGTPTTLTGNGRPGC